MGLMGDISQGLQEAAAEERPAAQSSTLNSAWKHSARVASANRRLTTKSDETQNCNTHVCTKAPTMAVACSVWSQWGSCTSTTCTCVTDKGGELLGAGAEGEARRGAEERSRGEEAVTQLLCT